jgi:hypothetical protein
MDLGLLGKEGASSGLSGVNGRETVSGQMRAEGMGESRTSGSDGLRVDRRLDSWVFSISSGLCEGLR